MPIEAIKPYPNNAKKHKIPWIKESIDNFGFDQPIVIDKNGVIIKGHGRYEAAKRLKMETVPVVIRDDLDEKAAAMSRLADNRSQQGGGFDFDKLGSELDFLQDSFDPEMFENLGFNETFLKKGAKEDLGFSFGELTTTEDIESITTPQKNILSIVLEAKDFEKWTNFKEEIGKKTDTSAFLKLMEKIDGD